MKSKLIVATVVSTFAVIGAAQATPRGDIDNRPFQGSYQQQDNASASRTQVLQELHRARANGLSSIGDSDNAPFLALADTGLSRAQVAAQVDGPTALGDSNNMPFEG